MKIKFIQKLIILTFAIFATLACTSSEDSESKLCEGLTCSGYGVCKVVNNAAKCICDEGYISDENYTCIEDVLCDSNTCTDLNKNICAEENGIAICLCNDGYIEDDNNNCIEEIVELCKAEICTKENKTICNETTGVAVCSCIDGYTEDSNGDCIKNIVDVCENITCSNSGECIEVDGKASCDCNYTHLSWQVDCIEKIAFFDMAISENSNEKFEYFWENYEGPVRNSEKVLFVTRSRVDEVIKLAGGFNSWNPNDIIMSIVEFDKGFRYKKVDINHNEKIYYKYISDDWYPDPRTIFFDFNESGNSVVYPLNSSRIAKIIVPSPELNNPEREIYMYFPALYYLSNKKFPVMYMQDGDNIFNGNPKATYGTWDVDTNADEAISDGLAEPIIIVGITTKDRSSEYLHIYIDRLDNDLLLYQYSNYLINTLKPVIDNNFKTLTNKENTAISGSSLGGISSFFISWENSSIFGKAGVFSPSSWIGETEEINPNAVESMRDLIESTENMPELKIYIDSGDKNFDGSYEYYADSRGHTEYVRNLLVAKGWDMRSEWLEDGETELINYSENVDQSLVPTIYWSENTPNEYSDYYDYLKPENNLLHLVGAGHVHNESAWNQRFKAALIFLFPKKD